MYHSSNSTNAVLKCRHHAALMVLVLALACCSLPMLALAGTTNSWRAYTSLSSGATLGPNLLANPGMETTAANQRLANWTAYGAAYTASTTNAHAGARSLQCVGVANGEVHGGSQTLALNRTSIKSLKLSGWSKAEAVTGPADTDYSVYLDIQYTNGSWLYGQTINFSPGTHDWEYKELFILPAFPIKQVSCYLLFRNGHTGTVWFDDITLAEALDTGMAFDGAAVISSAPSPLPFNPATRFSLATGDGLQMLLTQDGGVIETLNDRTNRLATFPMDYASGWLICDRNAGSDYWNVGGWVTQDNGDLVQNGVITNLNLAAQFRYSVTNSAIRIQATVSNLLTTDRAISLYFALPASIDTGVWWHSPREQSSVTQAVESATLSSIELGARNLVSQYPLATVTGTGTNTSGLTLAVAPDQYRPYRLIYNRQTRQFIAAFDLALSSLPINFPQTATAEVWLYRSDSSWGLRAGLEGYYNRFPSAFTRSFTNEGVWVAFADVRGITNISDFGIGYHEIGYNSAFVKSDDTNKIQSFRYVSEPWSYWMTMPTNISNTDSAAVNNYLIYQHNRGVKAATAALSSGLRDASGVLKFQSAAQPWCPYGAVFSLNASPFISDPVYPVTKFNSEWNSTVRNVYQHPENGILDGEYIDSFLAAASAPDYSSNHLRTTTFPLTYHRDDLRPMTPLIYGSYEMARAIAADVHAMGKPIMANTLYIQWPGIPIGVGLFDFAGTEMNFFDSAGNFLPPSDASLLYARALSGTRPYGYLLNTDFSKVSHAEMESYMRICAVYGIYPSAFSADAASNNYFEQPTLYERDRSLFIKYVPVVRALSTAGWLPVTGARADSTNVALEAFGTNVVTGAHYLTVRNLSSQSLSANATLDFNKWAFTDAKWLRITNLFDASGKSIDLSTANPGAPVVIPLSLQSGECRVYRIIAGPAPAPTILNSDDGAFGAGTGNFTFKVSAIPGQIVVIEKSSSLGGVWSAVRTNPVPSDGILVFSESTVTEPGGRYYRVTSP